MKTNMYTTTANANTTTLNTVLAQHGYRNWIGMGGESVVREMINGTAFADLPAEVDREIWAAASASWHAEAEAEAEATDC